MDFVAKIIFKVIVMVLSTALAYYPLDSVADNILQDVKGERHLALSGTPTVVAGKVDNAVNFTSAEGERGMYETGHADFNIAPTEYLSIAGWVYPTAIDWYPSFVAKQHHGSNNVSYALGLNNGSSFFRFLVASDGIYDNRVEVAASSVAYSFNNWYFVAAWWDHTNINIQVNNGTIHQAAFAGPIFESTAPFFVGGVQHDGNDWNGRVDNVVISKSLWTAEQRSWMYNGGAGRSLILESPKQAKMSLGIGLGL